MTEPLLRQADELLALAGEGLADDDELLEATHKLRDVIVEYDDVNARFEAAGSEVKRLLLERAPYLRSRS